MKVWFATVKAVQPPHLCSGLGGLPELTDVTFLCDNKDEAPLAHDPNTGILVENSHSDYTETSKVGKQSQSALYLHAPRHLPGLGKPQNTSWALPLGHGFPEGTDGCT